MYQMHLGSYAVLINYSMLDTKAIRNLNKVTLIKVESGTQIENNSFWAYLKSGNSLNLSIKTQDAFAQFSTLIKSPLLASAASSALEGLGIGSINTTALDVTRKTTFMGGEPLSFNLQCTKFIETDYQTDIVAPVLKLCSWMLPERDKELLKPLSSKLGGILQTQAAKHNEKIKEKDESLNPTGGVWGLAQKALSWFNDYVGEVYSLKNPEQFSSNGHLLLKMPGVTIDECFIRSVNLGLPYVSYVDEKGSEVIEKVDITLAIETMRMATLGNDKGSPLITLFGNQLKAK